MLSVNYAITNLLKLVLCMASIRQTTNTRQVAKLIRLLYGKYLSHLHLPIVLSALFYWSNFSHMQMYQIIISAIQLKTICKISYPSLYLPSCTKIGHIAKTFFQPWIEQGMAKQISIAICVFLGTSGSINGVVCTALRSVVKYLVFFQKKFHSLKNAHKIRHDLFH